MINIQTPFVRYKINTRIPNQKNILTNPPNIDAMKNPPSACHILFASCKKEININKNTITPAISLMFDNKELLFWSSIITVCDKWVDIYFSTAIKVLQNNKNLKTFIF